MTHQRPPVEVLLVEDDQGDVDLTLEILQRGDIPHHLNVVDNGVKALHYLERTGEYSQSARPDLIILDLNLPKKDGRTVLQEIKTDPRFKSIPVIILTTSKAETDISKSYFAGANCYINKPAKFPDLAEAVKLLQDFWFKAVALPTTTSLSPTSSVHTETPKVEGQNSEMALKILLVEDDQGDADFFREMILREKKISVSIDHVEGLGPAIENAECNQYDVILLDLGLPESQGMITLEKFLPHSRGVAIVVLTGISDEEVASKAISSGAQDYIVKRKASEREFTRIVRDAMERKRMLQALQEARDKLEVRVEERTRELTELNQKLKQEVHERTQAQRAVERSEVKVRGLLESAPDSMVIVNKEGQIVLVNARTESLFGYKKDELIGKLVEVLVPERYREQHPGHRTEYFSQPKLRPMGAGLDLFGRRKDGSEFPVEISLSPIQTEDGTLVSSAIRDISVRKEIESHLRTSLREKEILLKEIHHRVKNNLQITSSILSLQARTITDPAIRELFVDSENRIKSMALIHEKLYQSGRFSEIDVGDFMKTLAPWMLQSLKARDIGIELDVGHVILGIDKAIPFGLIANELISNCVKHAFTDRDGSRALSRDNPKICLKMKAVGENIILSVADNGIGFPIGFDFMKTKSLGLQIVKDLSKQLGGVFEVNSGKNAEVRINLPAARNNQEGPRFDMAGGR